MRLLLTGRARLELAPEAAAGADGGPETLEVLACGVCRTDAKMWHEGHRDLEFPRVPGHEVVVADAAGRRYAAWPGNACGTCPHCRTGRANLCESMEILGFHRDGGFARRVAVPPANLVPVPEAVPDRLASFAEPAGCALHAVGMLGLQPGERVVIYGGGSVGLIAALACRDRGAVPTVIEKNAEKIARAAPFLEHTGIACCRDTAASRFDAALTACPDPVALSLAVVKLDRGGRLSFFSGLTKNETLETNLLNLLHYKEVEVRGAYGLLREDLAAGLELIARHPGAFERLIEEVIPLSRVPAVLEDVLSGRPLKYVVDPQHAADATARGGVPPETAAPAPPRAEAALARLGELAELIRGIRPPDEGLRPAAQHAIDDKTKPLGALGTLEDLAVQLCLVQGTLQPRLRRKALFVFAGDHGVAEEGVSAFPAEVTAQMVHNFLAGGAAINVLCRHHGVDLRVVDMGVNAELPAHPALLPRKVRRGTRNFAVEPAMTAAETRAALAAGARVFLDEHARRPIDAVGLGEMGIANSSAASAIICAVTGISPEAAAGRGTGVDDQGLEHKAKVLRKALALHRLAPDDAFGILQTFGGYEIAGLAGAVLAAAASGTLVVLDGLISTAAGLLAHGLCPAVGGFLVSGHRSVEAAQQAALAHLGLEPIVDFRMRLGEGTGAAMALDVVDAACRILEEMATFEEAGVSRREARGAG